MPYYSCTLGDLQARRSHWPDLLLPLPGRGLYLQLGVFTLPGLKTTVSGILGKDIDARGLCFMLDCWWMVIRITRWLWFSDITLDDISVGKARFPLLSFYLCSRANGLASCLLALIIGVRLCFHNHNCYRKYRSSWLGWNFSTCQKRALAAIFL